MTKSIRLIGAGLLAVAISTSATAGTVGPNGTRVNGTIGNSIGPNGSQVSNGVMGNGAPGNGVMGNGYGGQGTAIEAITGMDLERGEVRGGELFL